MIMSNIVTLREVMQDDLLIFFKHQQDPEAARMAAFPSRDRGAFMAHWAKIMKDDLVACSTILFDRQVAGNIVNFAMLGKWEVGYWIGKEFWGRGIASEALK